MGRVDSTAVIDDQDARSLFPAAGDLIALPPWQGQRPYRVVSIAPSPIPDWVRLDGYLVESDGRCRPRRVDVPPRYLRRLPDPPWPAPGQP